MRKLHPAFVTAFATFCVLLCAAAIRATPGVLIVPLEHKFGWSRASISFAISVNLLLYGLMGPFCAAIAARIGIRRTMALAMGLLRSEERRVGKECRSLCDWSSDVCSSDLHLRQPAALRADGAVLRRHRRAHRHPAHHGLGDGPAQIGRASCRERV